MIYHVSKPGLRLSALLSFFIFCAFTASAAKCRILLENENEVWQRAFLTYSIYNADGSRDLDRETTVEMTHVGGPFWIHELDVPANPCQLFFSDGQGRVTHKFNGLWDLQWPENICFKDTQTSNLNYDSKAVIFFDVIDRNGWFEAGFDNILTDIYYADDGTLFHAWSHKSFEAKPRVYLFGERQGETSAGFNGRIYHFAMVNESAKSPCIWLRRADSPSNAIVAPLFDGAVLTPEGDDCTKSVYASYSELYESAGRRYVIIPYDMDGFAIPYADGEFAFEWSAPKERISQLAFTLTPGENSFIAGAIAATDASNIEAFDGRHRFTSSPADAWCAVESNAGRDPSIEYDNTGSRDIPARVSLRFDNSAFATGKMNFSAPPVNPFIATMRQILDEDRTDFALRLSLRWNPEADFTLSDGRNARGAIAAIALTSPDGNVIDALARSGGFRTGKTTTTNTVIIDSPDVLRSIKDEGFADIVFSDLPPYPTYNVSIAAIPADDLSTADLALMNFGYRENTSASPTSPQTIIAAPTITFASHRIQPIDVPLTLAKKLTAAEDMPQGHGATYYTAASRIHTTCRLQGLASVPEGWSAAYRLIAADGSVIAETTATDIELHSLSPDANDDLHAIAVYTNGAREITSDAGWRPASITDDIFPEFTSEGCDTWLMQKAAAVHSIDCGSVYDLAFECRHRITRDEMPSYIGFNIIAENAGAHNGHIAPSQTNAPRLMSQHERHENPLTGTSVSGNAGYTAIADDAEWAPANDWAGALARNGRAAFYIHHFHCQKPITQNRAGSDEAEIRAAFDLHTPVIISPRPALSSDAPATIAENERIHVRTSKAADTESHSTTIRIPLDDLDNVATGIAAPTVPASRRQAYNIQGIPVDATSARGIYITDGRKIYK